jgi:hypothetical protein
MPVDFSGTEAAWLGSNFNGTLNIPVTSGPAIVPIIVIVDGTAGDAITGTITYKFPDINLGASFGATNLDILSGTADSFGIITDWQSATVPELNGANAMIQGPVQVNPIS